MAFSPPTFNVAVSIWRTNGVGGVYAAPALAVMGNVSQGRRVLSPLARSAGIPAPYLPTELLLPARTDIRGLWNGVVQDLVEVPAGTKRFYTVMQVDDVGRGFANEYRLAILLYQVNGNGNLVGGPYAAPVPLP